MFRLEILALLAVFSCLASACRSPAKSESDVKIIGGTATNDDPAIVAIYVEIMAREARFMCTGTLIAPNLVLTAAHCLNSPKLNAQHVFRVFSGGDLRDPAKRPRPVTGGEAHFDPAFDRKNPQGGHDIGVLTLRTPMDIAPIPYMRQPLGREIVGSKVRVVGFGQNHGFGASGSEVKRTNDVKVNALTEQFVEVGGWFNNVCRGDSGGPVLLEIDGVETVIGVNSYGTGSCHSTSAATRVDPYSANFIDPLLQAGVAAP
jgi:V8-like Glu-specific endopeptidase